MQTPDKDRDRLDLWLDRALRQQGNIEPRTGLENRLLSKLHSREEHVRTVRKWSLILGSPVLAVLLIALVWHGERAGMKTPDLNAENGVSRQSKSNAEQQYVKTLEPSVPPGARDVKAVGTDRHRLSTQAQRKEPRLEHFPSLRPPSPEELVMARYAERYPQEATLISQKQQQFDNEIRKVQQEIETQSAISNE
jgi:hypothetical protein